MLNEHKVEHFRTLIGLASDGKVLIEGFTLLVCELLLISMVRSGGEEKAPGSDQAFASLAMFLIIADNAEILQVPYN